jgi:hypothetical protein
MRPVPDHLSVPWTSGTVMAGRSLRLVEERQSQLEWLTAAGWLVIVVGLRVAIRTPARGCQVPASRPFVWAEARPVGISGGDPSS